MCSMACTCAQAVKTALNIQSHKVATIFAVTALLAPIGVQLHCTVFAYNSTISAQAGKINDLESQTD